MEVREKYIARVLNTPREFGFDEIKFIHSPQIQTARWTRLRCQYHCQKTAPSELTPPHSPTAVEMQSMIDEFKFGLMVRREEPVPFPEPPGQLWARFQDALIEAENESFIRGYKRAFAIAAGNCQFCHHDDSLRPCEYEGKKRPTLEAVGINLADTLAMIAWDHYLLRDPGDPFQMFGLLLLE